MNTLTALISTSDLAAVYGVNKDTINVAVKRLELNGVLRQDDIKRNNYGGYMFNEQQATLIKQEVQSHHNLATRKIDTVSTQLEENQTIFNALQILQRRNNELTLRAQEAEKTNALLMHTAETYTFTQLAKELNKPVKGFALWLHDEGYIYYQNGAWLPYAGKESLFEQKQIPINESFTKYNTHITQQGRCELLKKYGGN